MLFMEPFWIMMDTVRKGAEDEDEKRTNPAYVQCLNCRGYVSKRTVRERGGCYLCGMSGEELARIAERMSEDRKRKIPYRLKCPHCGALVVTKELRERGCYLCGWTLVGEKERARAARELR